MNSAKIVKYGEIVPPKPANVAYPPPPPPPVWTRDPIYFDITMPEKTPAVVVLNGRTQKRMKTVARKGVDLSALGIADRYEGDKKLDVRRVSATADRVKGKEAHEGTFEHGDPLIFVFLKSDGSEQKRVEFYPENENRITEYEWRNHPNYPGYAQYYVRHLKETRVEKGDALDTTPVPVEMNRLGVRFAVKGKDIESRWFDAEVDTRDVTLGLDIGRGLIKELGGRRSRSVRRARAVLADRSQSLGRRVPDRSAGEPERLPQGSPREDKKVPSVSSRGSDCSIRK